ncbi:MULTISPECIES: 16S rRNA (adenine(1518)-N(6)/adenine(1519)-N(6))-dimethyltransferase RsmA [unclassified Treponema]|uniref:16S rRNA (adenine(1518)-N(6)/adenine(1519)-N(6))- dimethyltransferase RsmA n=1 Tax=unclassified Treponema TaxID=2638727 RepID=UPI0020A380B3|nr:MULTISPECIES: 16S rRNA (adenine(1518)-N(6)/adenine(1519)-N(6))-dimethyltransferase RsmA [unclassified Treponema]UTC65953.1 16S rRNA (adenine(1518)-N(6)/adenine(1519)-N(6))-dimethyltransferase RsmA [Treponema sp. OMZ 789]UTC68682.1 16S rRNA (adenine(1518)-N(6)/adenine(1519)-N(6))-dimethyltransferase RsmA [Treponema sp. OMZ 790]UTC71412.1 16S rRNA (adenine(1518)-N(6)/adenine(1519)-N(6))-dimethyltransferase RsmA [Treponema sp. OMZ 791]
MSSGAFLGLPNYDSPAELKTILDTLGFAMQKKFGQNFLIDRKIRESLVSFLDIEEGTRVWEVGPGLGSMTALLLEKGVNFTAFEIDKGFISLLKKFFFGKNLNFTLIEGDVQKNWLPYLKEQGKPDIFFGNLPYNIASELIASTVEAGVLFDSMLFTVQKEAAERITASPDQKNYTAFSVLCSLFYECKIVKTIPASAFWPRPNVESATVLFKAKKDFAEYKNHKLFIKIVKALFSSRRKNIKNNLSSWMRANGYGEEASFVLQKAGLNGNLRAESLALYDFLLLSDIISSLDKNK